MKMLENIKNKRDWAWDLIDIKENLLKKFKLSVFWVMGYKPGKNDSELVEYLNTYRRFQENILQNKNKESVNNKDYNPKKEKIA